jgi:hypothetical protein
MPKLKGQTGKLGGGRFSGDTIEMQWRFIEIRGDSVEIQ